MKNFLKVFICILFIVSVVLAVNYRPSNSNTADGEATVSAQSDIESESGSQSQSDSNSDSRPISDAESSKEQSSDTPDNTSGVNSSDGIKRIAFTFDDGPSPTYTTQIVDKLASYGGKGTFFVIGNQIGEKNGAAIQYAVNNGCEIGIHAYTHNYSYKKCSDSKYKEELSKTSNAIHKYLPDYDITLMRPVGGAITDERVKTSDYSVIIWSIDSNDWRYKKPAGDSNQINTIYNNIIKNVGDGDIVLMHEIYKNSYEAFCMAADKLYNDGYRFVTVTELIGEDSLQSGKKYKCA